jgi:hypothetical protein
MICSSNVFIIDNPDLDPKLRLKPDPNPDPKKKSNKKISNPQYWLRLAQHRLL